MSNSKVEATYHEGEYRPCYVSGCNKRMYWERIGAGSWRLTHDDGTTEHSAYADCETKKKKWWEFWK